MKTKTALLVIIAILCSATVYQVVQNHRNRRNYQLWAYQFNLAVFTQLYKNLDSGDADAAKQRLGALVTVTVDGIQKQYGKDADAKFALMLPDAKAIKLAFETKSNPSK